VAIRFGPFVLDTARRQLFRDTTTVHVTPKAFELLLLLVNAAPRVLSKRELHEQLWPGTYVSDTTLVGLVKELRRALDDRDSGAPLIRTAHRVGYAFCLEVETAPLRTVRPSHWLVLHGRRVALQEGENVIGRDPEAHVWLDAAGVSRRHARIVISGSDVLLEDLGSKNGTTVGSHSVEGQVALRDGDRITFGSTPSVYKGSSAGMSTETRSRSAAQPRGAGLRP
jgi:DNA-binding winged helix-turn-helix (wHTH) protein